MLDREGKATVLAAVAAIGFNGKHATALVLQDYLNTDRGYPLEYGAMMDCLDFLGEQKLVLKKQKAIYDLQPWWELDPTYFWKLTLFGAEGILNEVTDED